MKEMRKYIDELIAGNDENIDKLKDLVKEFFKGKVQEDFDKIDMKVLNQLASLKDVLVGREKITIVDRALLENAYGEKPDKYFWIDEEVKLHPRRLKCFRDSLVSNMKFDEETKDNFSRWVDWIISDEIGWDDGIYNSVDMDFRIRLDITSFQDLRADIHVFMIGDKKYKKTMEDAWLNMRPNVK